MANYPSIHLPFEPVHGIAPGTVVFVTSIDNTYVSDPDLFMCMEYTVVNETPLGYRLRSTNDHRSVYLHRKYAIHPDRNKILEYKGTLYTKALDRTNELADQYRSALARIANQMV